MRKPPTSPEMPFPGAAAPISRLVGRYAICTFAGLTLTVFDWEAEIRTEFADGTAHGDLWDVPVPLKYLWTARARGYYHIGDATYLAGYANQIGGSPVDLVSASFVGYRTTPAANAIFTGNGFLTRVHFSAPEAMAEQEVEVRGTGLPTVLV